MQRPNQGKNIPIYVLHEQVQAFVPEPLPPNPPIEWSPELSQKFTNALLALGRLDSIGQLLPESELFIDLLLRKEALCSCHIKGSQGSLLDLMLFELKQKFGAALGGPLEHLSDIQDVNNYIIALRHGLAQLKSGKKLDLQLICDLHALLLPKGKSSKQISSSFRHTQNWIGGTRANHAVYVPPPGEYVSECMQKLQAFAYDQNDKMPAVLKAALMHVQFELIHPFQDGNGRLGRLLVTLLLNQYKVLHLPLLSLSLFFKKHQALYYQKLNEVRLYGDWEVWLDFFADALCITANHSFACMQSLLDILNNDRERVKSLGRAAISASAVHQALVEQPLITADWIVKKTKLTPATVNKSLVHLEDLGIARETTLQKRNRLFCYQSFFSLLAQNDESISIPTSAV